MAAAGGAGAAGGGGGAGGAAAGAGGGGGAAAPAIDDSTLIDCKESVLLFMDMIGIADKNIDKFMKLMTNLHEEDGKDQAKELVSSMRLLSDLKLEDGTPDQLSMMMRPKPGGGDECVRGSFGCMMLSKVPNVVWKSVDILSSSKHLPMVLTESFIQFILCNAMRDSVVQLLDIRRNAAGTRIYICMERASNDVYELLLRFRVPTANGKQHIADMTFMTVLLEIIDILVSCYKSFHFVHRDAKTDNFVYVLDAENNVKIKMIDFGMSCIDVAIGDTVYSVVSHVDNYDIPVHCAPQQDMLLLLYELRLTFGRFFVPGGKIHEFYQQVIPFTGALHAVMTERQKMYNVKRKHLAAYNKTGSLTLGPANYLTPQHVIRVLNAAFAPKPRANVNRTRRKRSNSGNSGNSPIYQTHKPRKGSNSA